MDGQPPRQKSKHVSQSLNVPACIQVYVWTFMVTLGVSPTLYLLLVGDGIDRVNGLESIVVVVLIQALLWMTQRRCSSEDLSYWEGLLIVAVSVTTGENVTSLVRSFCLLFAVVVVSVLFALDHNERCAASHAGLRFGKLVIRLYRRRSKENSHS